MRAWGEDTVRGGQTVFHGIRMWTQLVRVGLLLVAALTVTVPVAASCGALTSATTSTRCPCSRWRR